MRRLLPALLVAVLALLVPAVGQAANKPALSFTPSAHDFGTIGANTSASQLFTLTNNGARASGKLTVTPLAAPFAITANSCTGKSLRPGQSCSITVAYSPTSDGASDSASLSVTSTKPAAHASASLSGASTSPTMSSQQLCEAAGGTYSTDPSSDQLGGDGTFVIWTCNDTDQSFVGNAPACFADGGHAFVYRGQAPPYYATCYA